MTARAMMKNLFLFSLLLLSVFAHAQTTASLINFQKTQSLPADMVHRKEDTLEKQFVAKGLTWPAKYVYFRSFKFDSQMEVWVKNELKEPYKLFKTYRVCALAGTLGPKRMEGDYQVPEGFYYISEFNPRSLYHLSLGLNYPNASDKILSDSLRPGSGIYIHGSCVTVGCIPMTDDQIEDLYIIAAHAQDQGEDFIPVHIFPIRYSNKRSVDYLAQLTKNDGSLKAFEERLESVYDHFEITHQLPVIMTNKNGDYVFSNLSKKVPPPPPVKRVPVQHRTRTISNIPDAVHQWPLFPGGGNGFLTYLDKMGHALAAKLPEDKKKAYITVEFIVDSDGTPVNFKMIKGVNEDFDDEVITVMEQMPAWQPALLNNKPVPKLIRQTFVIE